MPSHGLQNVNILEQEVDFTILTTGKRDIDWHPENDEDEALYLLQNDSQSSRLIFEIPRVVNNHDMLECDMVQIHYINVGSSTQVTRDIYYVNDLKSTDTEHVEPEKGQPLPEAKENEILRFSWIVGPNATQYVGTVQFAIHFICLDDEDNNKIVYDWCTGVNSDIQIVTSLDNAGEVVKTNSEILLEWRDQLMFTPHWVQNPDSEENDYSILRLVRNWDGTSMDSPESLRGPEGKKGKTGDKGEKGDTGNPPELVVGSVSVENVTKSGGYTLPSVEISYDNNDLSKAKLDFILPASTNCVNVIDVKDDGTVTYDDKLYFFVGTKSERDRFDELNGGVNKNIFQIITDDDGEQQLIENIDKINTVVKSHELSIDAIENVVNNLETSKASVYKYSWYGTDATSEPANISFPSVKTREDGLKIYAYYDIDGNPVNIVDDETIIIEPLVEYLTYSQSVEDRIVRRKEIVGDRWERSSDTDKDQMINAYHYRITKKFTINDVAIPSDGTEVLIDAYTIDNVNGVQNGPIVPAKCMRYASIEISDTIYVHFRTVVSGLKSDIPEDCEYISVSSNTKSYKCEVGVSDASKYTSIVYAEDNPYTSVNETYPSNSSPNSWWTVGLVNGTTYDYNFIKSDRISGLPSDVIVTKTEQVIADYDVISNLFIKLNNQEDYVEVPLDGSPVIFENKMDDDVLNTFNGDGLKNIITARYLGVSNRKQITINLYTFIKVKNFTKYLEDGVTLRSSDSLIAASNSCITYTHDPLNKYTYEEYGVTTVKAYSYNLGTNAIGAKFYVKYGTYEKNGTISVSDNGAFYYETPEFIEFLNYLKRTSNSVLKSGDFIVDADNNVFKVIEAPTIGDKPTSARLFKVNKSIEHIEETTDELVTKTSVLTNRIESLKSIIRNLHKDTYETTLNFVYVDTNDVTDCFKYSNGGTTNTTTDDTVSFITEKVRYNFHYTSEGYNEGPVLSLNVASHASVASDSFVPTNYKAVTENGTTSIDIEYNAPSAPSDDTATNYGYSLWDGFLTSFKATYTLEIINGDLDDNGCIKIKLIAKSLDITTSNGSTNYIDHTGDASSSSTTLFDLYKRYWIDKGTFEEGYTKLDRLDGANNPVWNTNEDYDYFGETDTSDFNSPLRAFYGNLYQDDYAPLKNLPPIKIKLVNKHLQELDEL